MLADFGFDWTASGGSVLHNSLNFRKMNDQAASIILSSLKTPIWPVF